MHHHHHYNEHISKKKSNHTAAKQPSIQKPSNGLKTGYGKQKYKTQPSPKNESLHKDQQIKSGFKKVVNPPGGVSASSSQHKHHRTDSKQDNSSNPTRLRIKSRNQMTSIPNIRTSLTPKNYGHSHHSTITNPQNFIGSLYNSSNYYEKHPYNQPHSTKNKDTNERILSTGRMDLKNFFDKRKHSAGKSRDVQKSYSRVGDHQQQQQRRSKISPRAVQSSLHYTNSNNPNANPNRDDESTIKVNPHHRQDDLDVRVYLTSDQYEKFGDRFPDKFKRIALLGRGGFSVVWLGVHKSSKKKIAVKQILTKNPHETHLKEIWFGSYFFEKGGEPREQFQNHIGINNICRLYYHQIKTIDTWLFYQVCEESLGSSLFELKGETMLYKPLLNQIKSNVEELKHMIVQITKALFLMNSHNIVHSDLKTQNILIKVRNKSDDPSTVPYIKSLKLIDFGSSFLFTNLKQFSMATPEYMPPEILNYILYQNKLEYDEKMLKKMELYLNPWVVDVWSLGCIVLEIISGLPLWMSIPTKIDNLPDKVTGLFAVKGRLFNKIIAKQIDNYSGIKIDEEFVGILERMLSLQPQKRISPVEILNFFGVPCKPQKVPFY